MKMTICIAFSHVKVSLDVAEMILKGCKWIRLT